MLYNQIADMTPLANLTNLQRLWLSHNQIADVTPLANLSLLRAVAETRLRMWHPSP